MVLLYMLLQDNKTDKVKEFVRSLIKKTRESKQIYRGSIAKVIEKCLDESGNLKIDELVEYYRQGDPRILALLFAMGEEDAKQVRLGLNKKGHKRFLYNIRPYYLHMMELTLDRLTSGNFAVDLASKIEMFSTKLGDIENNDVSLKKEYSNLSELAKDLNVSEDQIKASASHGRSLFILDDPANPNSKGKVLKIQKQGEDKKDFRGATVLKASKWGEMQSGGYMAFSDELKQIFEDKINEDEKEKAKKLGTEPKQFSLANDAYIIKNVDPKYYCYIDELDDSEADEVAFWDMLEGHVTQTLKLYEEGCVRKRFSPLNHDSERTYCYSNYLHTTDSDIAGIGHVENLAEDLKHGNIRSVPLSDADDIVTSDDINDSENFKKNFITFLKDMLHSLESIDSKDGGDELREHWKKSCKQAQTLDPVVELLMVPYFHILIRYNKYPRAMLSKVELYRQIRKRVLIPFLNILCPEMSEDKQNQYLDSIKRLLDDDLDTYEANRSIHESVQVRHGSRDFPLQGFFHTISSMVSSVSLYKSNKQAFLDSILRTSRL